MATSILRPTANRAVHLMITPRLSNLGESREVLRLISQFGEVEYFKNLKYDALSGHGRTSLVIFKDEEAAQHCLHKSPIRFRMGRAPVGEQQEQLQAHTSSQSAPNGSMSGEIRHDTISRVPSESPFGWGQSRSISTKSKTLPKPPPRPNQMPFEAPPPPLLESRVFQIQANTARVVFRNHINSGHYYGKYPLDTKSIAQQDLVKSVPAAGLSCVDWKDGERPWRIVEKEKEVERSGPERRKKLRELYEEGPSGSATFRDEALPG